MYVILFNPHSYFVEEVSIAPSIAGETNVEEINLLHSPKEPGLGSVELHVTQVV